MRAGLANYGVTLGITQITLSHFQDTLNAFISADGAFNAARSAKQTASDSYHGQLVPVKEWLYLTRNVLAGRLGNRWTTEWAQAGFVTPSVSLPTRIDDQLALVLALGNFLTANVSYQVGSMGVTPGVGEAARDAAVAAQLAVASAQVVLEEKSQAWTPAYEALRALMRCLIKILEATIANDDPRWLAFGLQMPASVTTPGQPVNVQAALDGMGGILVQCDAVALAQRYRWRMRRVGVQPEFELVARSVAPLATIATVLPGQTVEILVQAVNGALQGVPSEPIFFTLTASASSVASAGPAPAAVLPRMNGKHGENGHAALVRAA